VNRQLAHHGKYVKLFDWLRRQSGPRVTVSFDKVEEVSGSRCHHQAVDADQLVIMAPPNDDVVYLRDHGTSISLRPRISLIPRGGECSWRS
jgi:hypothetical protein